MKMFVLAVSIFFQQIISAQIYLDASSAFTVEGTISEVRVALFMNQKTAISGSSAFYTDGVSYETFPRIGLLKLHRTKNKNWKLFTYGVQISGIGSQRELSDKYDYEFLRISPFINFRSPVIRLYKDCKCGKPPGLNLELVGDLNIPYPFLGIGIRKGI